MKRIILFLFCAALFVSIAAPRLATRHSAAKSFGLALKTLSEPLSPGMPQALPSP